MNRLKFLVLFCLVFLLSGCKSDKKEVEYLTYDTRTKIEYYNNFFSDLSNIINTSNISIRMITNEGVNEQQGFFMQLDTITEKDNFKDIYFSLLMSDSYGVEIYHKNNKTIIGFKNKDSMEWYNSSMNIDSI
ncbi:MAG: hypothetical protein IJZ36_03455, partial [Bacilli bacterium]|nr:hypothetical protein [Bacilli bacterium]